MTGAVTTAVVGTRPAARWISRTAVVACKHRRGHTFLAPPRFGISSTPAATTAESVKHGLVRHHLNTFVVGGQFVLLTALVHAHKNCCTARVDLGGSTVGVTHHKPMKKKDIKNKRGTQGWRE